jgi:hypothetical protein
LKNVSVLVLHLDFHVSSPFSLESPMHDDFPVLATKYQYSAAVSILQMILFEWRSFYG